MGRSLFVFAAAISIVLFGIAIAQDRNDSKVSLWAGISVPQAVFNEAQAKALQVSFAVVNDGTSTVNPKIAASHLSINGAEPRDWPIIIINGLHSPEFFALPPGHVVTFGYLLGERYFAKPGVYTVRWWGDNFTTALITFRVLPDKR